MSRTDDLEEELYCPICSDMYVDPLMLQCTHSFCRKCLQEQIKKGHVTRKSAFLLFDCPVCRKTVTLDENGLDGLPKNRLLQKMVDAHKKRHRKKEVDERSLGYCHEHSRRELGAYCSGCHDIVCIDCIVGKHKNHTIESVEEVYSRKRKLIEHRIADIEEDLRILGTSEADEYRYMEQIKKQCKEKSDAIESQFDEFIGLIQQSKDSVLSELASRQHQEIALVHQSLETIHSKQRKLEDRLATLNEKMKQDIAALLKERCLDHTDSARSKKSQTLSKIEEDVTVEGLRSPRTRCFTECSLDMDCAGLESIINSAHLIWEPETDLYSPKHMADRFTQLFETEWKAAYAESTAKNKDEVMNDLLAVLKEAYQKAERCCEAHLEHVTYHMLQPDIDVQVGSCTIHGFNNTEETKASASFCGVKESLRKLRALSTATLARDTIFMMHHELVQLSASLGNSYQRQVSIYANKCFELCFLLQLQDPPLCIQMDTDKEIATEMDKENYKFVKRKGRKSKTVAWPPLYLYSGGPVITKGVVFMPTTAASV